VGRSPPEANSLKKNPGSPALKKNEKKSYLVGVEVAGLGLVSKKLKLQLRGWFAF
jgi:hypothetical protein